MATDSQLALCKAYGRIDGDDEVVRICCDAAIEYLHVAGAVGPPFSRLYDLALCALTLHYYDHRDDVAAQQAIPVGTQNIINQLKLSR